MGNEITISDVFNENTLVIFTDASIVKSADGYNGCSGSVAFFENDDGTISEDISLVKLLDTTNNESEAYAIYLGLLQAINFRNKRPDKIKNIYLFSDSKISLIGIREWIYKWVENVHGNVMMSSSGKPVANQGILLKCIQLILENDLEVVLSHTDGHVKFSVRKELYESLQNFRRMNHMVNSFINMDLYEMIARCNDIVDNVTRDTLLDKNDAIEVLSKKTADLFGTGRLVHIFTKQVLIFSLKNSAFTTVYAPFDIEKYKRLTGGTINGQTGCTDS